MELDNLHYSFNSIDGYNKPFNFIVSEREDGKTTAFIVSKMWSAFKKLGRPSVLFRRFIVDITEAYINSIQDTINKFSDAPVTLSYKKGTMAQGVVDVYDTGNLMFRVIGLSQPLSRIKSLVIKDVAYFLFDEFICNTRMGEKYLPDEAFKVKEAYNTFYREATTIPKFYALGNPYSLYCPFFSDLGISQADFKKGVILSGSNWAAQFHDLSPELKEAIIKKNPLYVFEDAYTKYALHGEAINDSNIWIMENCPPNFKLDYGFIIEGKILGVFSNNSFGEEPQYWIAVLDEIGKRKKCFCFDFKDLVSRSILFSMNERNKIARFRAAVRSRSVAFKTLECDYLIEEIYTVL